MQQQLNNKSDKINTQLKNDFDVLLSILQAGINNRVLINAVDINGKFKINATTNDILKNQKVYGSTSYNSLDLSFNTVDKTAIFKVNVFSIRSFVFKCIYNTRDKLF